MYEAAPAAEGRRTECGGNLPNGPKPAGGRPYEGGRTMRTGQSACRTT